MVNDSVVTARDGGQQMLVKPSGPAPDALVRRASQASGRARGRTLGHAQAEDDLLAFLLISNGMLITGRTLRSDVPPGQLSESELIEFWAEDGAAAGDGPPGPHGAAGRHGPGRPR